MIPIIPLIPLPIEAIIVNSQPLVNRTVPAQVSRSWVRVYVKDKGWSDDEWICLDELLHRESRWDMSASNPKSSAYGLFQVLKTPKDLTLKQQVNRGLKYLEARHSGSACQALKHHDSKGWY
jgi:hypothetical protein